MEDKNMPTLPHKILIHLDTQTFKVYRLAGGCATQMLSHPAHLPFNPTIEQLQDKVDGFLLDLSTHFGVLDNHRVRIYATGVFQDYPPGMANQLVIHIYVHHGLYLNVVPRDLSSFYSNLAASHNGSSDIIHGLVQQEFRQVVVCGSFQHHFTELGRIVTLLRQRNIHVLSPWTTKLIPETVGTNFVRLEGQQPLINERDGWTHRSIHMDKFRQSDAIIICNPGGHIGRGTTFELGYMCALYKRIIFTDDPIDLSPPFPYEVGLNF